MPHLSGLYSALHLQDKYGVLFNNSVSKEMKEPSEKRLHTWLDSLLVAHVFIHSDSHTFAEAFRRITKRADFIVFPDGKKPYCIDVKEKRLESRNGFAHPTFEVTRYDIEKLTEFQRLYRMRVWLVLTPNNSEDAWYFIDLHHVNRLPAEYLSGPTHIYIPYTGMSENSCYRYFETSGGTMNADKGFFTNYLTKNSPTFKE